MLEALRHEPEAFDLALDDEGFVTVADFVYGFGITQPVDADEDAVRDVLGPDGGAYFDCDGDRFRAVTGHTTEDFDYPAGQPTFYLYYLIDEKDLSHTKEHGLVAVKQRYLRLERSPEDAIASKGRRRIKKPVIATIDIEAYAQGVAFYHYCGAWYCESVPPHLIKYGPRHA